MKNLDRELREEIKINPTKNTFLLSLTTSVVKEEFKQKLCLLFMMQKHFTKHPKFMSQQLSTIFQERR